MAAAYPLVRDIAALRNGAPFDLLVIGGGIYGAWTAYDAAQRGLRVALIEKNDWGSGTSSASSMCTPLVMRLAWPMGLPLFCWPRPGRWLVMA